MELFVPILNQMIVLFGFIVMGFILGRIKAIPEGSAKVLSSFENIIFIPALVMGTFIDKFTVENLAQNGRLLLMSCAFAAVLVPLSLLVAKLCYKEKTMQNIASYALGFSNFAFMGNAVFSAIFPKEEFSQYLVFTLPFWVIIYAWAIPTLVIPQAETPHKRTFKEKIKPFLTPMFIGMLIGMIIGVSGLGAYVPQPISEIISVSGSCMSPVAMILTGVTVAKIDFKKMFTNAKLYLITAIRLLAYPLIFFGIIYLLSLLPANEWTTSVFFKCTMCMVAMPAGLTPIVVPAAYGLDTSDAAGMALLTHIFSVGTIPLMFMLLQNFVL
jgi:predicted permease